MKKLITSFCLLNLSFGFVQAQENISIGPIAGFGNSWMNGDGNNEGKHTWSTGLMLNYSRTSKWAFGTEFRFSEEGANKTLGTSVLETQVNYIRVPLKLMYFFGEYGDRLRPKLTLGLSNGFLVGGEIKLKTEVLDSDPIVITEKAKDFANPYDFGVHAAVGLNYRLEDKIWVNLQGGYYHGLLDVTKATGEMMNRNLAITFGVTFGLGEIKAITKN